jgi:hypothetical protein
MTVRYGLHGRIGGLPARLIRYGEQWMAMSAFYGQKERYCKLQSSASN